MAKQAKDKNTELPEHHDISRINLDNGYYSQHPTELEEILQNLNTLLSSAGISITADNRSILIIDINKDTYESVTTRKAGRKKKRTNKLLEEIQEYRKTHTAAETAEWLGLTRQTFYRKMKQHKEANDGGDVEF